MPMYYYNDSNAHSFHKNNNNINPYNKYLIGSKFIETFLV